MNNKINFTEIVNSLIAAALILLSGLAIIVTLIEEASPALLPVLIFAIFITAFIVIDAQDNENVRRRN